MTTYSVFLHENHNIPIKSIIVILEAAKVFCVSKETFNLEKKVLF